MTHTAANASFDANYSLTGAPVNLTDAKCVVFRFYIHPGSGAAAPAYVNALQIKLRSGGASWETYSTLGIQDLTYYAAEDDLSGWYTVIQSMDSLVASAGSLDIAAIDNIRVGVGMTSTATTAAVTLCGVEFYGAPHAVPRHCVTFDDGGPTNRQQAAYLTSLGLRGTFYVIGGLVGTSTWLTAAQLHEMSDNGHLIANHSYDHTFLRTVGLQATLDSMLKNGRWMIDNGFGPGARHYAVPGGTSESSRAQYEAMRPYIDTYRRTPTFESCLNIDGRGMLHTCGSASTSASGIAMVDRSIAYGVDTLTLFHEEAVADISAYFDYLKTQQDAGAIRVVTVGELLSA